MPRRLAPLLSLSLACGPSPGDTTATQGATSGDTSGASASTTTGTTGTPTTGATSTSATSTTGTTSTSTTGTTSTSTTGTTSTGTTGPASVCDPQPDAVLAQFLIDGTEFPPPPLAFTDHCTVDSVTDSDAVVIVLTGCKADPDDPVEDPVTHEIDFTASPGVALDLVVGEPVVLSYFVDGPWWLNQSFALRRPSDELVLAGLAVSEMPGERWGPPLDFFAPLTITIETVCDPEPLPEEEPGSGFIVNEQCVQTRREQLRFAWQDGAELELIDRSTAPWPDQPIRVIVGAAERQLNVGSCADIPPRYVRALLLRHQP